MSRSSSGAKSALLLLLLLRVRSFSNPLSLSLTRSLSLFSDVAGCGDLDLDNLGVSDMCRLLLVNPVDGLTMGLDGKVSEGALWGGYI